MAIQYAGGTIVNATLTQSTGTRAELVTWIKDQLVAAGWTLAVSGTNDFKLNSATTPQSLSMRARVYDPGSGSSARIKISNTSEFKIQTGDHFLAPAISKTWRIIANKYQAFIFTPGGSSSREFVSFGTLWLPSFLNGVVTEAIWGCSNSQSDTDTTVRNSLRTILNGSFSNWVSICNGTIWEAFNPNAPGAMTLATTMGTYFGGNSTNLRRWHDDSSFILEPLMAWGMSSASDEAKIRGQMWDAVVVTEPLTADTQLSLDGRTFFAITNSNAGGTGTAPGTLAIAVT